MLINRSVLDFRRGDVGERTLGDFVQAAELARSANLPMNEASALANAAETQLARELLPSVLEYALASFRVGEAASEVFDFASTLNMLAVLFARLKRPEASALVRASAQALTEKHRLVFDERQKALYDEAKAYLDGLPEGVRAARRAVLNRSKAEIFDLTMECVRSEAAALGLGGSPSGA